MIRLPTVAQMIKHGFGKDEAGKLREVLEKYRKRYPRGDRRPVVTMAKASELLSGEGLEVIPAGRNKRSPEIVYVNLGDTYAVTLLWINDGFRIGDWGSIVERGNYSN